MPRLQKGSLLEIYSDMHQGAVKGGQIDPFPFPFKSGSFLSDSLRNLLKSPEVQPNPLLKCSTMGFITSPYSAEEREGYDIVYTFRVHSK
jgi:hypothetical protein